MTLTRREAPFHLKSPGGLDPVQTPPRKQGPGEFGCWVDPDLQQHGHCDPAALCAPRGRGRIRHFLVIGKWLGGGAWPNCPWNDAQYARPQAFTRRGHRIGRQQGVDVGCGLFRQVAATKGRHACRGGRAVSQADLNGFRMDGVVGIWDDDQGLAVAWRVAVGIIVDVERPAPDRQLDQGGLQGRPCHHRRDKLTLLCFT